MSNTNKNITEDAEPKKLATDSANQITASEVFSKIEESIKDSVLHPIENAGDLPVSYFGSFYDTEPMTMCLRDIVYIVKDDIPLKKLTHVHRENCAVINDQKRSGIDRKAAKENADKSKRKFPSVIVGAICNGGKETKNIVALLPQVACDIDHLNEEQNAVLNSILHSDPHVTFDGKSPSGKGRRVFVLIDGIDIIQKLWNESSEHARTVLYRFVWQQVADYAASHWGVELDPCCAKPAQIYSITHDEDVYFNPEALPLHIDMSGYVPPRRGRKKGNEYGETSASESAGVSSPAKFSEVLALAQRMAVSKGKTPADGRNDYLYYLAAICNQYGVRSEELVEWANAEMKEPDFEEAEIARTISSAYSHVEEHGTRHFDKNVIDIVERCLQELAFFRYNLHTRQIELCYKPGCFALKAGEEWHAMEDRDVKSIFTYVRRHVKASQNEVDAVIYTYGFAEDYEPMRKYVESIPEWNPSKPDYIKDYFDHLKLEDEYQRPVLFKYFKIWFERMVALALGEIKKNQLVPALIGPENVGKSFYWESLLPTQLAEYYHQIKPYDKFDRDMDILLSQKYLANFDEYNISNRDSDAFKATVGGGTRTVRRAYGRQHETLAMRSSMALTTNDHHYISFSEGNRRLLSIAIIGVLNFNDYPINHEGLYAQAYYEVKHGQLRESLTQAEIAEIKAINKDFMQIDACEDAILTYFEPATVNNYEKAEWLSATEIRYTINHGYSPDDISPTRISSTMEKLGFLKKKSSNILYRVVRRDTSHRYSDGI